MVFSGKKRFYQGFLTKETYFGQYFLTKQLSALVKVS